VRHYAKSRGDRSNLFSEIKPIAISQLLRCQPCNRKFEFLGDDRVERVNMRPLDKFHGDHSHVAEI